MSTAVAIFVKTPGYSPVKTRLAASIGVEAATAFHRLAAQAVAEVACRAGDDNSSLQPYWAVAEQRALGDPGWQDLPRLWQGGGTLGQRLHRVYAALLPVHARVLLIGADAPQLTPHLLDRAAATLAVADTPYVMGEAHDGGFWLFGGRAPIASSLWCGVRYSCADTAADLRAALHASGRMAELPMLADVDRGEDLASLGRALATLPSPSPAQQRLQTWLREMEATPACRRLHECHSIAP